MLDKTTQQQKVTSVEIHGVDVVVESGPDKDLKARIDDLGTLVIGSGEGADLRINDPMVSRAHVRLVLAPEGLLVVDEGSRNGTWLDSTRVTRVQLTANARLRLGASTVVSVGLDAKATTVPILVSTSFGEAIGISASMRHVFNLLERGADSDITILLEGESGVGKEVLARALHDKSPRADGPFVTVDCGAIPPNLIESELFGHAKGAFTGAEGSRVGLFEQANGGTIFLDELGELPLDMQPKLLRCLELREVRPVGANKAVPVDVRIVAATNRKLVEQVDKGTFRKDLFYRLAVARIAIPPLRDRPEDIAPLATAFYRSITRDEMAELPPDVLALLKSYRWPGNVRELKNVVQRHAFLGFSGRSLFDGEERNAIGGGGGGGGPGHAEWAGLNYHDARQMVLDAFEEAYLPDVMKRANGVMARAAELAGVARGSFYRMAERLESRGKKLEGE